MAAELTPEQRASYAAIIDGILQHADLEKISAKAIRQSMQERIDHDLAPQKSAITALIMERFDKIQAATNGDDSQPPPAPATNGHHTTAQKRKAESPSEDESSMSDVKDEPAPKKIKKSKVKSEADSDAAYAAKLQAELNAQARSTRGGGVVKKKAAPKKEKRAKKKSAARVNSDDDSEVEPVEKEKKGGFHKLMTLSEPLSALLGEPALSRPQTVKKIWEYVRERDLQDPGDRRQIRCDDAMRAVFKQDQVHMFTMNKILATHLFPVED